MAHPPTNPTDPAVERAVKALAAFGHLTPEDARALLSMYPPGVAELSEQQQATVIERAANVRRVDHAPGQGHGAPAAPDRLPPAPAPPEPAAVTRCSICGGPIEHVTELEPAYWRHLEAMGDPHVASPAETYPQGWGRCDRCRVVRPDQHIDNGTCWWCAT